MAIVVGGENVIQMGGPIGISRGWFPGAIPFRLWIHTKVLHCNRKSIVYALCS